MAVESVQIAREGQPRDACLRPDMLRQIHQALDQLVAPELRGTPAGAILDLSLRLLGDMLAWETDYPTLRRDLDREQDAIRAAACEALAAAGLPAPPDGADDDVVGALTALLAHSGPSADPALRERAMTCLARLWRAEWRFRDRFDPEVRRGRASLYGGGAIPRDADEARADAAAEPTITAAKLQSYLRASRWPDAEVDSLVLLPGGFGKETSRASVRADGTLHDIIIRRDLPVGAIGYAVRDEMPAIRAAFAAGIAVAEPLWLETGPVFDTPFLVTRAVAGSTDVAGWRDRPECVERFATDLARELARLHALPPLPEMMADAGQRSTRDWIERDLDQFGTLLADRNDAPTPLLPAAFAWLRANIPESGVSPRLLHGDVGFHNLLMEEGRVNALIDWEYVHPGDPQQELNYVRPFLDELGGWDSFVAAYQRAGGVAYREQDRRFWQAWTGIRTSIGCVGAMRAFGAGNFANPDAALKLAVAGLNFGPRHLLYSVQDIVGGAPSESV